MRSSFSLAACVAALLLISPVFGQTPVKVAKEAPKQISGGVLNGKATHLPKPVYPEAAKAVGATGAVNVQVLIDEEGYVATAAAVSGHPLLRAAAVEAAHSARFSPTTLNGQAVKVSGVITYNFVTDFTPTSLGYELALAEKKGTFRQYVAPESLAAQLPAAWLNEKRALTSLTYEPVAVKKMVTSDIGTDNSYSARKLTPDSVAAVRELQSDIDAKLRADQNKQWAFNLGQALGKLVAEIGDDNQMRINTAELEQLTATAPQNAQVGPMNKLKAFVEKAKMAGSSVDERKSLAAEADMLRSLRY
jgi:TonB family protein